jgi:hypothetical protein
VAGRKQCLHFLTEILHGNALYAICCRGIDRRDAGI